MDAGRRGIAARWGAGRRRGARWGVAVVGTVAGAVLLASCGGAGTGERDAAPGPSGSVSASGSTSPTGGGSDAGTPTATAETPSLTTPRSPSRPARNDRPLGTVPPPWLGTRVLPRTEAGYAEARPTPAVLRTRRFTLPDSVPMLPGRRFASKVVSPAPDRVIRRSTWAPGCPVGRAELDWVRVTFRGFDGRRHTGELLVHRSATRELVGVFRDLWRARFPLEQMKITTKAERDAPPTGDGNNTGAFVCRPVRGGTTYSEHAYGLAVDVNPFHNPYVKGEVVLPELATAYRDRSRRAPGMIHAGGPVVRAFREIGWGWGGTWRTLKDWQHFSARNR